MLDLSACELQVSHVQTVRFLHSYTAHYRFHAVKLFPTYFHCLNQIPMDLTACKLQVSHVQTVRFWHSYTAHYRFQPVKFFLHIFIVKTKFPWSLVPFQVVNYFYIFSQFKPNSNIDSRPQAFFFTYFHSLNQILISSSTISGQRTVPAGLARA
jgi:hypothetical protein